MDYLVVSKEVGVYYIFFGDNHVKIAVWVWIYNHLSLVYMVAQHDIIARVIQTCKDHNVSLVVPISYQSDCNKDFLICIFNPINAYA